MPIEHKNGFIVLTGAATEGYRIHVCKHALGLWVCGIKSHRGVKLRQLLAIASEVTGKHYTASKASAVRAIRDIERCQQEAGNLETLGADVLERRQHAEVGND